MGTFEGMLIFLLWATSWGGGLFIGYHEGKKAATRTTEMDTTNKEQS